jgi:hypothetical protein
MTDLPAQSHAVLSLVLTQGRSFDQIAALLRLDAADVRARAHAAADMLMPSEQPSIDVRQRIADYLLGQQSLSERAQMRAELGGSAEARRYANDLARALAPLATDPLPAIPEAKRTTSIRKTPATPRLPGWRVIATLAAATAAVVVALILLANQTTHKSSRTHAARSARSQPNGAQTLHRLVLQPAGPDRAAFGAGAIVRQGGTLLLLLQARGLRPNHGDSYAVWLFNTPTDSRLLGFVSPLVGPDGTFSSGISLPDDAVRFRTLVVTRETRPRPSVPGQSILRSPLSLS